MKTNNSTGISTVLKRSCERLKRIEQRLTAAQIKRTAAFEAKGRELRALKRLRGKQRATEEVTTAIQQIVASLQEQSHSHISRVVSQCLKTVFDDPYTFSIEFHRLRKKTEASFVLKRDGINIDPMEESGGGVVDVVAFALRVAVLLQKAGARRLLVLDEPFKHLSTGNRPRIRLLLNMLAKEFGIQFVIVTHDPELQCGTVIRID